MRDIEEKNELITKERMLLAICLIMIVEHEELNIEELIKTTGMEFAEVRKILQNLVLLNLIKIVPTYRGVPIINILNKSDAKIFLKNIGF